MPSLPPLAPGERRVPDLYGKSARSALVAAQREHLLLALSGSGVVIAQTPNAGSGAAEGATIQITLGALPRDAHPAGLAEQAKPAPATNTRADMKLEQPAAGGRDG